MKLSLIILLFLVGCDEKKISLNEKVEEYKIPEVNDENCNSENFAKMPKEISQKFSSLCLRRSSYTPSKQRFW